MDWKRGLVGLIGIAILGIKGTLEWGWLGTIGILGVGLIVFSIITPAQKLLAVRLRAAFGDSSGFAVAFQPFDPRDYRRFGAKQWRRQSYRALLAIDRGRLTFRPDKKSRLKGRNAFSVPLADIRTIVVRRPHHLRPGAMAFVELQDGGVLHFRLLDRGAAFVAALRAAGVPRVEED
ncbi:hypothetical protein ACQEVF_13545 [Nonomuraea polychroma]|uniref:hypothetical protein n=1 Tax=Nonomuraea polychroma TaxID=46176 RepID=UPI003D8F9F18